jgi:hypothetical protein
MDELFRFSITRAADRTDSATVPLERNSPFQVNPPDPGPTGLTDIAASASRNKWADFETASLAYLLSARTLDFIKSLDASPIAKQGTQFVKKLKETAAKSLPLLGR